MKGVIVIGQRHGNSVFIDAVEFPDGSRRTAHFSEHFGARRIKGNMVDHYKLYFDDAPNLPVDLYKRQNGLWFLDE